MWLVVHPTHDDVDRLTAGHVVLRQRFRIDALRERLSHGPVEVVRWDHGSPFRNRSTLWLESGLRLELTLFWPAPYAVAELIGLDWSDSIGWLARVRDPDRQAHTMYAWRAMVRFADPGTSLSRHHRRRWMRRAQVRSDVGSPTG